MHIQNMTIHFGHAPGIAQAMLAALAATPEVAASEPAAASAAAGAFPPAIGEVWPGKGGVYAGLSRGEEGQPDAHLVLLDAVPEKNLKWADALAWALAQGDGARLPTRFESALLYANLRDRMETGFWHWTGTQYSDADAWLQHFFNGVQISSLKSAEGRVRAVRRFTA